MITENAVTSVAVPEVDGIAIKVALLRSGGIVNGSLISSKVVSGCS